MGVCEDRGLTFCVRHECRQCLQTPSFSAAFVPMHTVDTITQRGMVCCSFSVTDSLLEIMRVCWCFVCVPYLQTLNVVVAGRLQERLELLATLQAGMQQLPSDWHTQVRGLQTCCQAILSEVPFQGFTSK